VAAEAAVCPSFQGHTVCHARSVFSNEGGAEVRDVGRDAALALHNFGGPVLVATGNAVKYLALVRVPGCDKELLVLRVKDPKSVHRGLERVWLVFGARRIEDLQGETPALLE